MTEGTRLLAGRYEVGALIGHGGMADVHLGTDTRLGRRVAIKLLKPSLATDPKFRILFREEAQKAARMAHPTIVRVFDAGEETIREANGRETQLPFIVMEYVDGRLLKDIITDGPLEPKEAIRIISGVLTALEYSHRALLVHRDIKPGNIMVTQNGQVKVMDFGIARAVSDNSATVADTSAILGTAQYFSPEQARGESVDARTDLYSTGVVLFELLTGRPPFRGDRPAAVAYQHISEQAPAPSSLNPRVSPALDAVVLHSLSKDKFDRFQTAGEFRADLEAAAAGNVPVHKPVGDFNATLFGVNPHAVAGSEATLRQLSATNDERLVRTQTRPPVAWIWAGVAIVAVIIGAVMFWVLTFQQEPIGRDMSVKVPGVVGAQYEDGAQTLTKLGLVPNRVRCLQRHRRCRRDHPHRSETRHRRGQATGCQGLGVVGQEPGGGPRCSATCRKGTRFPPWRRPNSSTAIPPATIRRRCPPASCCAANRMPAPARTRATRSTCSSPTAW